MCVWKRGGGGLKDLLVGGGSVVFVFVVGTGVGGFDSDDDDDDDCDGAVEERWI